MAKKTQHTFPPQWVWKCLRLCASKQQKPKWRRQKVAWVLIQQSHLLSGSFHMQNTRQRIGQKGTLTITASHCAAVGESLFRLIDKWKSWNSLHLKWPLARIEGSSSISCLKWEKGKDERAWEKNKKGSQFSTLQKLFRIYEHNTQRYCRGFKAQI